MQPAGRGERRLRPRAGGPGSDETSVGRDGQPALDARAPRPRPPPARPCRRPRRTTRCRSSAAAGPGRTPARPPRRVRGQVVGRAAPPRAAAPRRGRTRARAPRRVPGVRIVTATGAPLIRISSGSSTASTSRSRRSVRQPQHLHGRRAVRRDGAHGGRLRRRAEPTMTRRVRVLIVGSGGREHALAWALPERRRRAPCRPGEPRDRRARAVPPGAGGRRRRAALAGAGARDRPRGDRPRGAARRRRRRRAARRRDLRRSGRARPPRASRARRHSPRRSSRRPASRPRDTLDEPAAPCVVKADGLAAGKGVLVCRTEEELDAALAAAAARSTGPSCFEELLEGEELSVFALCDGERSIPLGAARDHKRVGDGDTGPNTGGMGAFSPVPGFGPARGRGARRPDPPAGARAARAPRHAVRRAALRRPDADRRRAAGARVQLPLRRPRDAGRCCRSSSGDLLGALAAAAAGDLARHAGRRRRRARR